MIVNKVQFEPLPPLPYEVTITLDRKEAEMLTGLIGVANAEEASRVCGQRFACSESGRTIGDFAYDLFNKLLKVTNAK